METKITDVLCFMDFRYRTGNNNILLYIILLFARCGQIGRGKILTRDAIAPLLLLETGNCSH